MEAQLLQLEEEEKRIEKEARELEKRARVAEEKFRESELKIIRAEERLRKANVELGAIKSQSVPESGPEAELHSVREQISQAEEKSRVAANTVSDSQRQTKSALAQLAELESKLQSLVNKETELQEKIRSTQTQTHDAQKAVADLELDLQSVRTQIEDIESRPPNTIEDLVPLERKLTEELVQLMRTEDEITDWNEKAQIQERIADVTLKAPDTAEIAARRFTEEVQGKSEARSKETDEKVKALQASLKKLEEEAVVAKEKRLAEEKARQEAEEKARREAQERAQREAEEKLKKEQEEREAREKIEQEKKLQRERDLQEAEASAQRDASERARQLEQEKENQRIEAEERARREAAEKVKATMKKRGGPMQIGALLWLDIDKVKEELAVVLRADNNTISWIVVGYEADTKISFQDSGLRVEDLQNALKDDQVQFVVLRIPTPEEKNKLRDILVTWLGPEVRTMEKMRKRSHYSDIKRVLQPFNNELTANGRKNFNVETILARTAIGSTHEID